MANAATRTTTGQALASRRGRLLGAVLIAGSDAATVVVYNNTSAAGTIVLALAASAANTVAVWEAPDRASPLGGVPFDSRGLWAVLTGTTPRVMLYYGN